MKSCCNFSLFIKMFKLYFNVLMQFKFKCYFLFELECQNGLKTNQKCFLLYKN